MSKISLYYFKLMVGDAETLVRFYSDAFGMKEVGRFDGLETEEPHIEIFLKAEGGESDQQLALMHYVNRPTPTPGEAAIAFMVDDVDAVVAAALAAGGSIARAAETLEEHKFRYAIVADPEGHKVEVMQFVA